jgi:hypothetical protein
MAVALRRGLVFPGEGGAAEPVDASFIVDAWSTEGRAAGKFGHLGDSNPGWLSLARNAQRPGALRRKPFHRFRRNNTPGLNSDRIVYLFEDSHTNLWIGTDTAGVALVQDGKVKNFDLGRAGHEGRLTVGL